MVKRDGRVPAADPPKNVRRAFMYGFPYCSDRAGRTVEMHRRCGTETSETGKPERKPCQSGERPGKKVETPAIAGVRNEKMGVLTLQPVSAMSSILYMLTERHIPASPMSEPLDGNENRARNNQSLLDCACCLTLPARRRPAPWLGPGCASSAPRLRSFRRRSCRRPRYRMAERRTSRCRSRLSNRQSQHRCLGLR